MTTREIVDTLRTNGFTLMKAGARHHLYAKAGVVYLVCPGRSYSNPRVVVSLRAAIRRAARVDGTKKKGMAVGRYI